MNRKLTILLAIGICVVNGLLCFAQEHKAPPVTRVDSVAETLHGVTITDSYRWLEDQNSPETRAWINAQNEYTASTLGKDEALLDPNTMSADQSTSVQIQDVSADGKLMVYGVRQGGEDEVTISLLDVDTRKELADRLPKGRIGVSLKPDKTGFYYSRFTNNVGGRIYYHAMGTDPSQAALSFQGYPFRREMDDWRVVEKVAGG